jgi:hypothetical protein
MDFVGDVWTVVLKVACIVPPIHKMMPRRNTLKHRHHHTGSVHRQDLQFRSPHTTINQRVYHSRSSHYTAYVFAELPSYSLPPTATAKSCDSSESCRFLRSATSNFNDSQTWAGSQERQTTVQDPQRLLAAHLSRRQDRPESNATQHAMPSSNVSTRTTSWTA